jgi:Kdo2-lipid IVA lauroyltransferase/acyltransferase
MYYFIYGLFYLISLLPMRVLYFFSDGIYIIVYRMIGYRKDVVMDNLQMAFPEKTNEERIKIAKQFYHNLIDSFIETIKLLSASNNFLKEHVTANWEVLEPVYKTGKSCQLHLGHTFNWEWGQHVLTDFTGYQILVVYMPLTNKIFEKLMYKLRTRNGNIFISASNMRTEMPTFANTKYLLGLVADQSPGSMHNAYWTNFLGRPTPFVSGPERGARAGGLPVFFTSIIKPKRGYYKASIELACDDASVLKEGELTIAYARYMENAIRKNPEMWLWSHRRWKHNWKPEHEKNWIGKDAPIS